MFYVVLQIYLKLSPKPNILYLKTDKWHSFGGTNVLVFKDDV